MPANNDSSNISVEIGNTGAFLSLPGRLYPAGKNPRDITMESKLLSGRHVLSKYFDICVFTASRNSLAVSRCAITFYPDSKTAYLGFFDSEDDEEAVKELFVSAEKYVLSRGTYHIAGPVDASFWLGYRMKANMFDKSPYFGEPCGLPWYQKLWEQNGYVVTDLYSSNIYGTALEYTNEKFSERLASFLKMGYKIESPKRGEWDKTIGEIYSLIMRLYSDFPIFKHISEEDFKSHYAGLKHIVDFSMVKMAHFNGKAVGFFISIPDYGYMLNQRLGFLTIARMLLKKSRPSRYVMLYLGADPEHKGLGKAITQTIIDTLLIKQVTSIGALIHQGKVNERYAEDKIEGTYRYILLEKHLQNGMEV